MSRTVHGADEQPSVRTPRGKPRLSRELILDTALELAKKPKTDSLRIRDLGKALSVDPSAVYRYFQNKGALMTALVDRLGSEILSRVDTSSDRHWRDVLVDLSEVSLELYVKYPAIGAVAASVPSESIDIVEQTMSALHRAGLRDDELVHHYALFASYLLSFTGAVARTRLDFEQESWEVPWAEDVKLATASSHPVANENRERILKMRDVDVYRASIGLILDSVATAARAPGS